jgi:hypothetical protein
MRRVALPAVPCPDMPSVRGRRWLGRTREVWGSWFESGVPALWSASDRSAAERLIVLADDIGRAESVTARLRLEAELRRGEKVLRLHAPDESEAEGRAFTSAQVASREAYTRERAVSAGTADPEMYVDLRGELRPIVDVLFEPDEFWREYERRGATEQRTDNERKENTMAAGTDNTLAGYAKGSSEGRPAEPPAGGITVTRRVAGSKHRTIPMRPAANGEDAHEQAEGN